MKANELRIGNWVGIKETALHSDGCNTKNTFFEIEELKKDVVHFKDFSTGEYYKDLDPIPLNEEWLLKFGFDENSCLWTLRFDENIVWSNRVFKFTQKSRSIYLDCDYVHSLQNLYFALTGQELELKLK